MLPGIDIVYCEEWVGVYRDGMLLAEYKELPPDEVLRILGIEVRSHNADDNWWGGQEDGLPENLSEIPVE